MVKTNTHINPENATTFKLYFILLITLDINMPSYYKNIYYFVLPLFSSSNDC